MSRSDPGLSSSDEDPRRRARGVRGAAERHRGRSRRSRPGRGARAPRRLRRLSHRPLHVLRCRSFRLCADRPRPRGSGGRRGRRGGRRLGVAGRSCRHALQPAVPRVRALPRRADEPVPRHPRSAEPGLSPGRDDAPVARRRGDPAFHGHEHVRRGDGDAGDRAGSDQRRGALRARVRLRMRSVHRPGRGDQLGEGGRGIDGGRLRGRAGWHWRRRRLPSPGGRADHLHRPVRGPSRARAPGRERPTRGSAAPMRCSASSTRRTDSAPTTRSRPPGSST